MIRDPFVIECDTVTLKDGKPDKYKGTVDISYDKFATGKVTVSGALGAGNSTVVLSTAGVGGGGSTMSVTIDETETAGENTSGFTLAGSSSLYLFPTAGGVHSDIFIQVGFEAA